MQHGETLKPSHAIKIQKTYKIQKQNNINWQTMEQLINVLLAIDKSHTVPQRALDCGTGLGGLN